MKEVEILIEVKSSKEEALRALERFSFKGIRQVLDVYFFDPVRSELQPDPTGRLRRSFRLRQKDEKNYLAYKIDKFSNGNEWIYSDEYEVSVGDYQTMLTILKNLGLEELVRVDNKKSIFTTLDYEIVLEDVQDLGLFLEVECLAKVSDGAVSKEKELIRDFLKELGIKFGEELNAGKPELMLARRRITNKVKPLK